MRENKAEVERVEKAKARMVPRVRRNAEKTRLLRVKPCLKQTEEVVEL